MDLGHYAVMVFLTAMTAIVLMVLIGSNTRIGKSRKALFLLATAIIMVSAVAEYLCVRLDGTPEEYRTIHIVLKVLELSAAPFVVYALIAAFNGFRSARPLLPLAVLNLCLEVISGFTGFLFYFDANNVYQHNTYYFIYTLIYMLCVVFFFFQCYRFSRRYQNRNGLALLAILLFLIAGLSIHIIFSELRADWMTIVIAAAMFYIYYCNLVEQTDSLTNLLDRKSYDIYITSVRRKATVIIFDIDSFKEVNDTYGHKVGDICLKTVASILMSVYGKYGLCFRTGGDEFCVIITHQPENLAAVNAAFCAQLDLERQGGGKEYLHNVSFGYADFVPGSGDIAQSIQQADAMMYKYKRENKEKNQS